MTHFAVCCILPYWKQYGFKHTINVLCVLAIYFYLPLFLSLSHFFFFLCTHMNNWGGRFGEGGGLGCGVVSQEFLLNCCLASQSQLRLCLSLSLPLPSVHDWDSALLHMKITPVRALSNTLSNKLMSVHLWTHQGVSSLWKIFYQYDS